MSSFTDGLFVELKSDGKTFRLLEPFTYYMEGDSDNTITVPVGFETDFASVPRVFTPLVERMGRHSKAAVVHDYLYSQPDMLTRKECDKVFLEAMKVSGVNVRLRWSMYFAVRLFGWLHFNKG